jgi:hypothetical protein
MLVGGVLMAAVVLVAGRALGPPPEHDGPPDGFRQDWKGRSYFSLRYRSPEGANARYSGRTSDQVITPERVVQTVRLAVRPNRMSP